MLKDKNGIPFLTDTQDECATVTTCDECKFPLEQEDIRKWGEMELCHDCYVQAGKDAEVEEREQLNDYYRSVL